VLKAKSGSLAADGGQLSPTQWQLPTGARNLQDDSPQIPRQRRMCVMVQKITVIIIIIIIIA